MSSSDPKEPGESPSGANGHTHLNGSASHVHDEDDPVEDPIEETPEELSPPPVAVAELAAAAIRFVASKYKVALDGSSDTLSLIDQYVREAREAYKQRPESIELVAPAVGAYLGEVMRHEFGGEWFSDGNHEAWRLYFHHVYLAFNPIGMAREAITVTEEPGWHAHFVLDPAERETIDERLAVMPEIDEDEYYLPTTRFDVLTVVVETLRARAEAAGTGDVTFSREDYT